ncbi:WecB/TagA/CpsF family glycosyltransferase [Photobacterium sp. 1_MG-2023]|uniref:WecB/TagA/CpsF family glycosyltransferase n=1 Tax=Photobacterium sp. 1_MG-2023 TaxID=3062646 RepID=UPI0026E33E9B|nr:WecB/TagA/CpsF family glycosyltransferase [Photobacterium sp. 1_MG-2023]MDO6707164.1 WecB/TagA/CpsF family glycosyltransferase [Photobacterium sp. 1_MG-2023]
MTNKVKISGFDISCYDNIDSAVKDIMHTKLDTANIAVAINPEKIVSAQNNKLVYQSIENSTIRYLDGIGTVLLARSRINSDVKRIPGCELWENLMIAAATNMTPVYLLGAKPDVLNNTKRILEEKYNANIIGCRDGYFSDDDEVIDEIIRLNPKIVSVALGSPRQEQFMMKCKLRGANFFMMGVGGTYDVFTGEVKRAPLAFRKIGLEWAYRLLCQPTRIFRQINLLKFIVLVLRKKI